MGNKRYTDEFRSEEIKQVIERGLRKAFSVH